MAFSNPPSSVRRHFTVEAELLDRDALDIESLAHTCSVSAEWVVERVESGLLGAESEGGGRAAWRFTSTQVVRARRIARLERDMDANPELAALVSDLVEEVQALRRQLHGS
ncbi:chaperone modulator CbpM [Xylophilus sp.]|uniref:chaperone modulator CbpM n=1 Tax=Xylophilus sp. TaxID=2653893 RepID=UPI0013B9309F|nr:chaperone modulator CbpM [Xylophilus sp.]KAF1047784.1 MAG: Chaperone modulatory protein CbpM [Xylophilus sp.]